MSSQRVPNFLPSVQGFRFVNRFDDDAPVFTIPVPPFGDIPVGKAAGGMCGGMVFAVLDLYRASMLPPADPDSPKAGTPLFKYIARRLLESFNGVAGVHKYLEWMRFPNDSQSFGPFKKLTSKSIAWHSIHDEWPGIKELLDSGSPCPLGLLKTESHDPRDVGKNHQVLAYGDDLSEDTGDLRILGYDPNCPNENDVTLSVNIADPDNPSHISYSADSNGRGFFRTAYDPADPSEAMATA